jgi:hypothetical protein
MALLTAPVGAAEQQYTQEQQDSCGSILCLAGGGATPECNPYLKRFFDTDPKDRKGYLNKCPDSGVSPGAIATLAAYGQTCQPDRLDDYLNAQICTKEQEKRGFGCRHPSADDWHTLCGSFYAELTTDAPPKLVERCRDESDDTGALAHVCHRRWVENDYQTGGWCKDKDANCEETDAGTKTESSAHSPSSELATDEQRHG